MSHSLTFTDDQLVVLDRALGGLPYREAAPVIASINEQLSAARSAFDRTPQVSLEDVERGAAHA